MFLEKKHDLGPGVQLAHCDAVHSVYRITDDSGDGAMTCYPIADGVLAFYNDFHMKGCSAHLKTPREMLTIDYCREGVIEWELDNHKCLYLQAGDVYINTNGPVCSGFHFPLNHYHGVTLVLELDRRKVLSVPGLDTVIDLSRIKEKYCPDGTPFLMRADESAIGRVLSGFYTMPKSLRTTCLKLTAVELLLYLSAADVTPVSEERPYFHKEQVGKVKAIQKLITGQLETHYTLEKLSEMFDMPLTSMKRTFKGVYGKSIGSYLRAYRMNTAAVLLKQTEDSVSVIAGRMGYDNASKFAAAFRSVFGVTPAVYRKSDNYDV